MNDRFNIAVLTPEKEDGTFTAIFPDGTLHTCSLSLDTKERIQTKILCGYSVRSRCYLNPYQELKVVFRGTMDDGTHILDLETNTTAQMSLPLEVYFI